MYKHQLDEMYDRSKQLEIEKIDLKQEEIKAYKQLYPNLKEKQMQELKHKVFELTKQQDLKKREKEFFKKRSNDI
jgi:hypothetical protein